MQHQSNPPNETNTDHGPKALGAPLEKGPDSDRLREQVTLVAQRLMDDKANAACTAKPHERRPDRATPRARLWFAGMASARPHAEAFALAHARLCG